MKFEHSFPLPATIFSRGIGPRARGERLSQLLPCTTPPPARLVETPSGRGPDAPLWSSSAAVRGEELHARPRSPVRRAARPCVEQTRCTAAQEFPVVREDAVCSFRPRGTSGASAGRGTRACRRGMERRRPGSRRRPSDGGARSRVSANAPGRPRARRPPAPNCESRTVERTRGHAEDRAQRSPETSARWIACAPRRRRARSASPNLVPLAGDLTCGRRSLGSRRRDFQ